MLKLVIGKNWISNRALLLSSVAEAVAAEKENNILIVPELISHEMERELCMSAGNTASRFAEVLSFSRLARRVADASEHCALPCLDEGGRVVGMAAAISQVHSKLKFFASVSTKPEFIGALVETVDECKRCAVDPASLMHASRQSTGILAQKLEELALIFGAYDAVCAYGKKDPRDLLTWLLEELEAGDYAGEHVFYIDGFSDFTRQQMDVLAHLIRCSKEVTVSLTCDCVGSTGLAFERPGETAAELVRIAKSFDIPVDIVFNDCTQGRIGTVADAMFEGQLPNADGDYLKVIRCDSIYRECEAAAEHIMSLVRSGSRYRDISVVCTDIDQYEGPLNMVFQRCSIPAYISGTQNILDRPVIATVLCAMDAALSGFERSDMLGYLKTALSPINLKQCDMIENYVLLWNITGKKWLTPWQMHPRGLVDIWDEEDRQHLEQLNGIRQQVIEPLIALREGLYHSKNAAMQTVSLYEFLEAISLSQRLTDLAGKLERAGDGRNAQILDQLWEILVNGLEQMHDILSGCAQQPEGFLKLFKTLLSRYDVGTIPTVLDAITVGSINAMRCKKTEHLLVLGAVEGALPGYGSASGVLTEQDRSALRDLGVPLNGGAVESLQTTFSEIYGVFSGASGSVFVSCPSGQPSYVYLRLKEMAGTECMPGNLLGPAASNPKHSAAYLLRYNDRLAARQLAVEEEFDRILERRSHVHGYVSKEQIQKLYGTQFRLSASQIDVHSNCAMSYFLKYGLRARERKPAEVDPAEFGTFVHDVLENTAKKIVKMGGFKAVSKEDSLKIAAEYAENYMQTHFAEIDSERLSHLLRRNGKELELIVEELWSELHNSEFSPVYFELGFGGDDGVCPPIHIQGTEASAKLKGFVDRVDVWNSGEHSYFRIVDYKTGIKTFDYCDVINGIGLQMLLYLFALSQSDEKLVGDHPIPAGVQYFPARAPVISVESAADEAEIAKEREYCWKRSGLLLNDDLVLDAMGTEFVASRMPYKRKKDGTLTGDLADHKQFAMLRKFIYSCLQRMVDDIASGNVTANPYTRDARKNACRFCPYGQICHKKDVANRRVYKAITAQRFWDDIVKEVDKHG